MFIYLDENVGNVEADAGAEIRQSEQHEDGIFKQRQVYHAAALCLARFLVVWDNGSREDFRVGSVFFLNIKKQKN